MQPCLVCGTMFTPRTKNSFYCLPKCRNKAWKIRNRESYLVKSRQQMAIARKKVRDARVPVFLDCINCRSRFKRNIHHPEQKCCSPSCNTKWYQKNHRKEVNQLRRASYQRHKDRVVDYNAYYKDELRFSGNRLRALIRDMFTCQNCGYVAPVHPTNRSEDIIVHHIDFSGRSTRPNNRIENLQTLCRPCHIRLHTHVLVHNR